MAPLSKNFGLFAVLIGIYFTNGSHSFECLTTEKCLCTESIDYEFQCPRNNPEVDIKVTENNQVVIQCLNDSTPYFDINILPEFDAHDIFYLNLQYCYLNASFENILQKFNMTKVKYIQLETWAQDNNERKIAVSKDMLKGLETLESLRISYSTLILDTNFLQSNPNLRMLSLNKNGLSEIDNYFKYVPKLQLLDLSRNQIGFLPDGIFQNLTELTKLHLWNNNLTGLTKDMFKGLEKLQLLELSSNHIEELAEDTFSDLVNLVNVSLRTNDIKQVLSKTFRNNTLLENIRLNNNPSLILSDSVFKNLNRLLTVDLSDNNFIDIPEHTFENCLTLQDLKLKKNLLITLPEKIFYSLEKLKKLDISYNKLSVLPEQVFFPLGSLEELNLSNNKLTVIHNVYFMKLNALKVLDLSKNKIIIIELKAFKAFVSSLTFLNLSFNDWNNENTVFDATPLNDCLRLTELDLQHNKISSFPELSSLLHLAKVDLSFNTISELQMHRFTRQTSFKIQINLTHNAIQKIDFMYAEFLAKSNSVSNYDALHFSGPNTVIDISNNPILCDCSNYDLIRYNSDMMSPILKTFFDIKQDSLYCSNFKESIAVNELKPKDINCPLDKSTGCPPQCRCDYRPYDKAAIVDCSVRNLTSYPVLYMNITTEYPYNQTILNLTGNHLQNGPGSKMNYENITSLDLSRNQINELTWIPPNIKDLNLNENKLRTIGSSIIDRLKNTTSLERVMLKNNPWVCDCDALDLQKYLMQYYQKVHSTDVYCQDSKTLLVKLTDLCQLSPYLTAFLPVVLAVLLCFAVAVAVYFRYQTEIKIYLYAKNLCLWFVTEEELDKDKTYDVFVSYSHQDEKFVVDHLLPELENGERPFKVCIHVRDWIPGEFITKQVVSSVKDSRRTLVVLSNNFVDSVWGKLEFRTAHTEAISEGRARVIVVIYGDLNEEKLDDELKSYLKTNTYVKWGDRYFWNKLKYALPHSKNSFYKSNKKHAKVMLKIDDKFELMNHPPSPTNTSTPPITLDPSLLRNKEVRLDIPVKKEGEAPLLVR